MMKIIIFLRFLPVSFMILYKNKLLVEDFKRWCEIIKMNKSLYSFAYILFYYKEFRNIVIYRYQKKVFFKRYFSLMYPPLSTLYIQAKEIKGGLFIQHGFSTMISAEYIGKNCWINQQVTIGYKGQGRPPIIGDNVMITCGAKVLGSITIGNNVVIGANAVVVKDVEDDSTMVGIPAKKIRKKVIYEKSTNVLS